MNFIKPPFHDTFNLTTINTDETKKTFTDLTDESLMVELPSLPYGFSGTVFTVKIVIGQHILPF